MKMILVQMSTSGYEENRARRTRFHPPFTGKKTNKKQTKAMQVLRALPKITPGFVSTAFSPTCCTTLPLTGALSDPRHPFF